MKSFAINTLPSSGRLSFSMARTFLMEVYDIVMLVVVVGATLFGAVKGLAWQLASIASILGSYFVAMKLREPFSQSISVEPPWNRFLAMLILYVGTALLIWVVFRMVSGSIDRMKLREFDNHIGAIFGLIKGALYCTLLTMFAVTLAGQQVREAVVRSKSGNYIAQLLDRSESVIPPEIHEVIGPYLERFERDFGDVEVAADGQLDVQVAGGNGIRQNSLDGQSDVQVAGGNGIRQNSLR